MDTQHTFALRLTIDSPEADPRQVPVELVRTAMAALAGQGDERIQALVTPVASSAHPRGRLMSYEVADLSLSWLTEHDVELLELREGDLVLMDYEYGWLVWCGGRESVERADAMRAAGYSEGFIALMERAHREGFRYINFDQDGSEEPDEDADGPATDTQADEEAAPAASDGGG
jgi:hypothetical protein